MVTENWKDVTGYFGRYQVSDLGQVRSFRWVVAMKNGRSRTIAGRELKPFVAAGYWVVSLPDANHHRGRRNFQVHRLVYKAFVGEIARDYHIHHKDGNKRNNHVDNLEAIHHSDHLSQHQGQGAVNASIAAAIRERYATGGYTLRELGVRYGLAEVTVHKIVTGKTWRHAAGPITHAGQGHGRTIGRRQGNAILNDSIVREIRFAHASGMGSYSALAVRFGIKKSLVAQVVTHRIWRHVT